MIVSRCRAKVSTRQSVPKAFACSKIAASKRTQQKRAISCNAGPSDVEISRRAALSAMLLSSMSFAAPFESRAEDTVQFKELADEILAYKFLYPVSTPSGTTLSMTLAHAPEKYSSAAPLTADARQRIVSELIDFGKFVTVSVTVGPPSGPLKDQAPETWKASDVATTVLVDRSTSRVSSGQRVSLNDIENAHIEERNGVRYYVYEHVSQGSPNLLAKDKETYRHAIAATTVRPGMDGTPYMFTLNLACSEQEWQDLEGVFRTSIESFVLTTPTNNYVPPDKNPWMFF